MGYALKTPKTAFGNPEYSPYRAAGITYYGYRYYDATVGRWLSRDPIGHNGGIHLYAFVSNNGVNAYDYMGLKGKVEAWIQLNSATIFRNKRKYISKPKTGEWSLGVRLFADTAEEADSNGGKWQVLRSVRSAPRNVSGLDANFDKDQFTNTIRGWDKDVGWWKKSDAPARLPTLQRIRRAPYCVQCAEMTMDISYRTFKGSSIYEHFLSTVGDALSDLTFKIGGKLIPAKDIIPEFDAKGIVTKRTVKLQLVICADGKTSVGAFGVKSKTRLLPQYSRGQNIYYDQRYYEKTGASAQSSIDQRLMFVEESYYREN